MAFHECGVLIVTFCLAYCQPTSQEQTVASNRLQQQISSARSNHGGTADCEKLLVQLASQLTSSPLGKESLQLAQAGDLQVTSGADLPEFKRIAEIPDPIHDAVQLERSRYRAALVKAGDDKSLRQDANATYAKALESAMESYKKAGVQESPRLAKLKLEIKMLTHSSCMGVWERTLIATQGIRIPVYEYWVVGIDSKTGEWKITGAIRTDRISAPAPLYHGDDVTSTKDLVKFKLNIHSEHPAPWPNGTAFEMTLKPESGQVTYVARSGSQKHEATLVRCTDNTMFDRIQYWDRNKGAFPELADHVGEIDIDSPTEVWRSLAALMSFNYFVPGVPDSLPLTERLYLQARRKKFTPEHAGYERTAGVLLDRFNRLAMTSQPYLQRAAKESRAIFRERYRIALFNQQVGNTPDAAERQLAKFFVNGLIKYNTSDLLKELERSRKQNGDPPFLAEFAVKFAVLYDSFGEHNIRKIISDDAKLSGYLSYGDMSAADQQAEYWQRTLVPIARRASGPPSKTPLGELSGNWIAAGRSKGHNLRHFSFKNSSGKELTNVVIEVIAENQWRERGAQYYFLPVIESEDAVLMIPNPRWVDRRLPYSNTLKVTYSIWSDQASDVGHSIQLNNPTPIPDEQGAYADFQRFDKESASKGEFLGVIAAGLDDLGPVAQKLNFESAAPAKKVQTPTFKYEVLPNSPDNSTGQPQARSTRPGRGMTTPQTGRGQAGALPGTRQLPDMANRPNMSNRNGFRMPGRGREERKQPAQAKAEDQQQNKPAAREQLPPNKVAPNRSPGDPFYVRAVIPVAKHSQNEVINFAEKILAESNQKSGVVDFFDTSGPLSWSGKLEIENTSIKDHWLCRVKIQEGAPTEFEIGTNRAGRPRSTAVKN